MSELRERFDAATAQLSAAEELVCFVGRQYLREVVRVRYLDAGWVECLVEDGIVTPYEIKSNDGTRRLFGVRPDMDDPDHELEVWYAIVEEVVSYVVHADPNLEGANAFTLCLDDALIPVSRRLDS